MDNNYFPDCLVLKIEENEIDTNELDTTLYVFYDKKNKNYIIRGQRSNKSFDSCTYSFTSKSIDSLVHFISFVICKRNKWSYSLYNYDNFPSDSNNISFDFLCNYDSKVYELSSLHAMLFNKKFLFNNLKMLKDVFNYYN
jgi:hypothetical protein